MTSYFFHSFAQIAALSKADREAFNQVKALFLAESADTNAARQAAVEDEKRKAQERADGQETADQEKAEEIGRAHV